MEAAGVVSDPEAKRHFVGGSHSPIIEENNAKVVRPPGIEPGPAASEALRIADSVLRRREPLKSHILKGQAAGVAWPDLVEDFMVRCRDMNLSAETIRLYREKLRHFLAWVRTEPEETTAREMADFLAHRRGLGAGSLTVDCFYRILCTLVAWAVKEKHLTNNITAGLERPAIEKKRKVSFARDTFGRVLGEINTRTDIGVRDYSLILFLGDSGARLSEAINLDLPRLSLENRTALVVGKGSKERLVYFGKITAASLERWLRVRNKIRLPTMAVWVNRLGDRMKANGAQQMLKKYTVMAGVAERRLAPHALRHFFSLEFLRNKGGEFALQKQLGHQTLDMTREYVDMLDDDARRAHQEAGPIDRILVGSRRVQILR